ncbi:MAG: class I SAM-dependent methyltransferase [Bergeyella cardium]
MKNYLKTEVQDYINKNIDVDIVDLLLRKSPFDDISIQEIAQQVKGKQICRKKFPFLDRENIIFPPHLNLEQSSSESAARYKSRLVKGKTFLDLTSGFGIDAYFLSQNFEETTLVERNSKLLDIVKHNWAVLGKDAHFINSELEAFLSENDKNFDVIFIDPARRSADDKKVFLLEDLSPNILEIQKQLAHISDKTLIKLSPLIDISYLISVIEHISEIHIVAIKNDVKEVLVLINKGTKYPKICCVNLETDEAPFELEYGDSAVCVSYSKPQAYLYIPNNAILKSGAFLEVAKQFSLSKLHPNTHLYTSGEKFENFPGRILKVTKINPKTLERGDKYNIISKNHPLKPDAIKKKYKISDGGERYLVFTQSVAGMEVLLSE